MEEGGGEVGGAYLCQLYCREYYYCYYHIILCTFIRTLWVPSPVPDTGPQTQRDSRGATS